MQLLILTNTTDADTADFGLGVHISAAWAIGASASVNRIWAEVGGRERGVSMPSIPASAITLPQSGNLESVAEPHHFS